MAKPIVEHIVDGKQVCRRCKDNKTIDQFWKDKNKPTGISQYCNICSNSNRQDTRLRVKTGTQKHIQHNYKKGSEEYKIHVRNRVLKHSYGITIEDYNTLYIKQAGCCSICKTHQTVLKRPLDVDHDHVTGKIRGLLCMKCNTGIGLFNDNIELLSNTIKYLQENNKFSLEVVDINFN